jgi:IS1 family transposase
LLRLKALWEPFGITRFYPKCFVSEITPGILERYHLQKQHVPPRQTGEAIAVRSTKGGGAYERHMEPEQHAVGKQHTQKIASKHINLRTRIKRLVRRTMCLSKTERMHNLVIGLFVSRYEFGRLI